MATHQNNQKILLLQPYDELAAPVFSLVSSVAMKLGEEVFRVESASINGGATADLVEAAISSASAIVADLTNGNPNVMYEYGVARALGKPIIVIGRGLRSIPPDIAQSTIFLTYSIGDNEDYFSNRLTSYLRVLLSDQSTSKARSLIKEKAKQHKVFISYSHSDKEYLDRLLVHLKPLEREGKIDVWVDTQLRAGDKWKREIESAISRANAVVLLISADFMASEFITNNELPPILKNAEERGTRVIPVIIKPSRFSRDLNLRSFQAANDPRHPLVLLSTGQQEQILDQVAEEVERWLSGNH